MRNAAIVFGAIFAVLAGVAYFSFFWAAIWNIVGVMSGVLWLGGLAASAIAIVLALTILFRPSQAWLYPLCFSAATLSFSLVALSEPLVALMWIGLGLATFALTLSGTYIARRFGK